jgi:hypothetical protein
MPRDKEGKKNDAQTSHLAMEGRWWAREASGKSHDGLATLEKDARPRVDTQVGGLTVGIELALALSMNP